MLEHITAIAGTGIHENEPPLTLPELVLFALANLPDLAGLVQRTKISRADIRRITAPITALDCTAQGILNPLPPHKTDELLHCVAALSEIILDWTAGAYGDPPSMDLCYRLKETAAWGSRGALWANLNAMNSHDSLITALTTGHNQNDKRGLHDFDRPVGVTSDASA